MGADTPATSAVCLSQTGSPTEKALHDATKTVIVQTAPAVRVAVGQEYGFKVGQPVTGKLVAGLKQLGFAKVFDTDFSADLTIMEEGHELVERVKNGKNLPILTSCCPGWINFLEHHYPDLLDIPSSCKSPQQMFGAIAKSYYAEKMGIAPKDLVVVSRTRTRTSRSSTRSIWVSPVRRRRITCSTPSITRTPAAEGFRKGDKEGRGHQPRPPFRLAISFGFGYSASALPLAIARTTSDAPLAQSPTQ